MTGNHKLTVNIGQMWHLLIRTGGKKWQWAHKTISYIMWFQLILNTKQVEHPPLVSHICTSDRPVICAPCHPHTASKHISHQHRRIMCALTWASTSDWRCQAGLSHTHSLSLTHTLSLTHIHTYTTQLQLPWVLISEQAKEVGYVTLLSHSLLLNGPLHLGYVQQKTHSLFSFSPIFFFFFFCSISQADAEPQKQADSEASSAPSMCSRDLGTAMLPRKPAHWH